MKETVLKNFAKRLKEKYPEQIMLEEPLKLYTTYQVGGPATALCTPASKEQLQQMVRECHQAAAPFYILGSGSNILVHDSGVNKIVIRLDKCCSELYHRRSQLYVGAGVLVASLVEYCENNNLAGLDFMSGIPGTIGGALRMNAGAFIGEIGDRVTTIDALTLDGQFLKITGDDAGFGYRRADNLQDKIMLGCWLELLSGARDKLQKSREEYLERRAAKQPLEYGSCGSVFKRPPGNYAGSLIEKAGCKGMQVGGAMVSPKHANFIVNYKQATATDIFKLIQKVQEEVYRQFKVWLELEVKLVGFPEKEQELIEIPHE